MSYSALVPHIQSQRLLSLLRVLAVVVSAVSFVSCKNKNADGGYPGAGGAGGAWGDGSWGGANGVNGAGANGEGAWNGGAGGAGGAPFDDGSAGASVALPQRRGDAAFFGPGSENVNRGEFEPVYFEFDRYEIQPGEQEKVRRVAAAARQRGATLIIAGFTDDKGTEEYNRVLGERRALSVRSALISQGVRPDLVQTVSFGEDMPAGSDAENRRAEFGFVR